MPRGAVVLKGGNHDGTTKTTPSSREKMNILFVCSGNICRSPVAEIVARDMFQRSGIRAQVHSAGTLNIEGHPASEQAIESVAELGLDLSSHRSRGLSWQALEEADSVVVMSPRHEAAAVAIHPGVKPKIVQLWEHSDRAPGEGIPDPIGCSYAVYTRCRDLIVECLENWMGGLGGERG